MIGAINGKSRRLEDGGRSRGHGRPCQGTWRVGSFSSYLDIVSGVALVDWLSCICKVCQVTAVCLFGWSSHLRLRTGDAAPCPYVLIWIERPRHRVAPWSYHVCQIWKVASWKNFFPVSGNRLGSRLGIEVNACVIALEKAGAACRPVVVHQQTSISTPALVLCGSSKCFLPPTNPHSSRLVALDHVLYCKTSQLSSSFVPCQSTQVIIRLRVSQ